MFHVSSWCMKNVILHPSVNPLLPDFKQDLPTFTTAENEKVITM